MDKEVFFFDYKPTLEKAEGKNMLVGYGIKWDVLSHDFGGYRTVFRKSSFDDLESPLGDLKAYYEHDYDHGYLARTNNGTFKVAMDDVGIRYSIELPDTQLGRDVAALAERDDIVGASIGIPKDQSKITWKREAGGVPIREFTKTKLVEISVVHEPAFPFTTAELVKASLEEFLKSVEPVPEPTPLKDKARRTIELVRAAWTR